MKKNAFTILLVLVSLFAYSQKVIKDPKTGFSTAGGVKLTKIELSDTATILSFQTKARSGDWIMIPDKTYIQDANGSEKIYIKRTEGIPMNTKYTMPDSGKVNYKLTFPAIAKTANYIDYGEGNDGGSWFIYDIEIRPTESRSILHKALTGNWFDKATGSWELGFFDKFAVYKNQLWSFNLPKMAKKTPSILLTNNEKQIELFYQTTPTGTLLVGESAQNLKEYSNDLAALKNCKPTDDKPYELPIFKTDSATYSGYLKGYTPRMEVKTLSIAINDIITGKQNTFLIKIAENGFFSVKLPISYPHLCYVRSSIYNGSIFLEPGKEVFQLIGTSKKLFMGESAKINADLARLESINSFNYRDMQRKILDMSPAQYKTYIESYQTKDLNKLDSIVKTNNISAKAYQVQKMDLKYEYASYLMEYVDNFESIYRQKNKIPRTQRTLPIKIDSLKAEHLDFITNEVVNNPLGMLSSGYDSFINRLKYLDILQNKMSSGLNLSEMVSEFEKSGYSLTESEKILIEKQQKINELQNSSEHKEFQAKYGTQISELYLKYKDVFEKLYKSTPKADNDYVEKYFKENDIKLTADETKLWKVIRKNEKAETSVKMKELITNYSDSLTAFYTKHQDLVSDFFYKKRNNARSENLKKLFGVDAGIATDIMIAQDNCRKIVEEVSPVSNQKLKSIQQQIKTPFIADYIAQCNDQSIAKLEANKRKTGFVVNETPKTEAAKIFDAIINKYKGKVIYVDFWATWCAPCRNGIEQIKPLKEELAGKNIVFVYITGQSSPKTTWANMIPDIKGEHYRVSNDEWNFLTSMFNISGIPHYVLVGKTGEIINPNLGHYKNAQLKTELEKYINE